MATRSVIARIEATGVGGADDTIKAVYCHSDGYLSNNGKILDQHYRDEDKVDELLAGGDMSSLKDTIKDTIFYHRDKKESYERVKASTLKNETDLIEHAFSYYDAELLYMFAYGTWYVYDNSNKIGSTSYQFIELDEALYNVLT
tara:strand:- start:338 stop:769 length:432 start_codon:yes stop_codon:yes gene_type:complete